MKVFLCLLIATVYAASAVPVDQGLSVAQDFKYPRYIDFPDGNEKPHRVDLEAPVEKAVIDEVTRKPANNLYILFTRKNPKSAQTLVYQDANSIKQSNFNPKVPTVVIAHGWLSNQDTGLNPTIRDAYLGVGDYNVIVLDWKRLAMSGYVTAVNGVPAVGRGLGQFLAFLSSTSGARLDTFHIVGFSLGAHLVGNAGRELGGKVARVTGLDPAGPLWNINRNRLNANDAVYVEAIHTDGGYTVGGLGIGSNVANADFYPNGGVSQPGCLTNICNHNNAWRYFAATVTYNHLVGKECSSSAQVSLGRCRGKELRMGNADLKKFGTGMYRVDTNRKYPY